MALRVKLRKAKPPTMIPRAAMPVTGFLVNPCRGLMKVQNTPTTIAKKSLGYEESFLKKSPIVIESIYIIDFSDL